MFLKRVSQTIRFNIQNLLSSSYEEFGSLSKVLVLNIEIAGITVAIMSVLFLFALCLRATTLYFNVKRNLECVSILECKRWSIFASLSLTLQLR